MFLNTNPTISLVPTTSLLEPVNMLPVVTQIYTDPYNIYYDPFRTYSSFFPNSIGYYVSYPDLNNDENLQKKVLHKLWDKLSSKWIFEFVKVFKYIKGSKDNYELVKSLTEYENNNIDSQHMESKAEWFLKNHYRKSDLLGTIHKYVSKTGKNLWDIDDNLHNFKAFVYHQIKRKLFERISS